MKYVGYQRVSTKSQGVSGLGLEAQRSIIETFTKGQDLLGNFVDIETGTSKGNNRPQLKQAIALAKKEGATLCIAKLDRLSRNCLFINSLMESGVEFIACDMPTANKFTIHIFAALAEAEATLISSRTRAALAELKKTTKLGKPENLTSSAKAKGLEVRMSNARNNENSVKSMALIVSLRNEGQSFYNITKELNRLGFKAARGGEFKHEQVKRLYDRATK